MDHRSRWAWVIVVTLVLALAGAWLTADPEGSMPVPPALVRQ